MGGNSWIDDDWDLTDSVNAVNTVVLVGKTGNGKSATGNSILGRKAFVSQVNFGGVTTTCEMQSTILKDGRTVNVIDTPGLFDFSAGSKFIGKEIAECINLAKDGIHAVIVVFSVRSHFSKEEEAAIQSLQAFFGEKITDYMIIVFTGGDDFEEDDMTLKDYIDCNCPEPLQKFLSLCKHRVVLFDNKTKEVTKRAQQVYQLFSLVDSVVTVNGGQPFSDKLFAELKEEALRMNDEEKEVESLKDYTEQQISEFKRQIYKSYDDQLSRITFMVEQKLKQSVERLENQLSEHAARLLRLEDAQMRSDKEICKFRESLESAQKEQKLELKKVEQKLKQSAERFEKKLKQRLESARKDSKDFQKCAESDNCALM